MSYKRLPPEADRLLVARLHGRAMHRAKWRKLTDEETAAAVADLQELAAGRSDLLAECVGILIGASEDTLGAELKRQAAELLIKAGADQNLLPLWTHEGRGRRQYLPSA